MTNRVVDVNRKELLVLLHPPMEKMETSNEKYKFNNPK